MVPANEWVISSSNRNLRTGLSELIAARAVLFALVKRELKSRYRGSLLGFAWALGKPLSMLLVYSMVIGEILGANRSIDYFALFLFIGLMFWGFFAETLITGTNSIVNAQGLVQKVAFPREILPLVSVVTAAINLLIQFPILLIGYIAFGTWPQFIDLANLFPLLLILILLASSLTLILSALNVYVRDVLPLTELLITLLMYATPILYSWTFVKEKLQPFLFSIYIHNPVSLVIVGIQDVLWPGIRNYSDGIQAEKLFTVSSPIVWITLVVSLFFLLAAYRIFLKLEPNFAREM